jgi:hypothetical protein
MGLAAGLEFDVDELTIVQTNEQIEAREFVIMPWPIAHFGIEDCDVLNR